MSRSLIIEDDHEHLGTRHWLGCLQCGGPVDAGAEVSRAMADFAAHLLYALEETPDDLERVKDVLGKVVLDLRDDVWWMDASQYPLKSLYALHPDPETYGLAPRRDETDEEDDEEPHPEEPKE